MVRTADGRTQMIAYVLPRSITTDEKNTNPDEIVKNKDCNGGKTGIINVNKKTKGSLRIKRAERKLNRFDPVT